MTPRFNLGDRVKIRRSWSPDDGALGIIAQPPEQVRTANQFGSSYFKEETTLTGGHSITYWVELDVSDYSSGTVEGGEFDETELEKL